MPRLFIAIDLPPASAPDASALREDELKARWTPEDQYHVTLRFLGATDDATTQRVREDLRMIEGRPFLLSGAGVDVFPSRRRPRVLVLRVETDPQLERIQTEIERLAVARGFPSESRPFNPHVTLGRIKRARPREVRRFLKAYAELEVEPFTVRQFHLYRSDPGPDGALHTVIESYPLLG